MLSIKVKDLYFKFKGEFSDKILIDVRTKEEYNLERITNSRNIPLDQLLARADELKNFNEIYIYCRSGHRSQMACDLLNSVGIKNCYNVEGGIIEWKKEGFSVC